MENDYVEIRIRIKNSTLNSLEKIVQYFNMREELINSERKSEVITVEELIRGAITREIDKIKTYNHNIVYTGDKKIGEKYTLKNRIKEILEEKNIKQLDLASLTGIDRSNISLIVNNRNQPSADYLFRIWVALDFYPLDEMFYREKGRL